MKQLNLTHNILVQITNYGVSVINEKFGAEYFKTVVEPLAEMHYGRVWHRLPVASLFSYFGTAVFQGNKSPIRMEMMIPDDQPMYTETEYMAALQSKSLAISEAAAQGKVPPLTSDEYPFNQVKTVEAAIDPNAHVFLQPIPDELKTKDRIATVTAEIVN